MDIDAVIKESTSKYLYSIPSPKEDLKGFIPKPDPFFV